MSYEIPILPKSNTLAEARRQVEICNACRYCEGYCAVFPAITRQRAFADGDLTQLANLCHNCQGCYHACQYTAPHEFALNLPGILADVRQESWDEYAWPQAFAGSFQRRGTPIALALVVGLALLFALVTALPATDGLGFYAFVSHSLMIAIFAPAFLAPMVVIGVGLRRYWCAVGGQPIRFAHLRHAVSAVATMRNMGGGQGQGCNFEDGDRFSNKRRIAHQLVMYGFLLCFAATSSATLMHYLLDIQAPYEIFSLPKLLGLTGGLMMSVGALWLVMLKRRADRKLGSVRAWGGEMAFVLLLGLTGFTGLWLYAATGTPLVAPLLALHLGAVLTFFLITPYSKMVHGFYRLAALVRDAQSIT